MGCDIHLVCERKTEHGWAAVEFPPFAEGADRLFLWRDYDLFSKLAGVRPRHDDAPPRVRPRGLPDDMSPEVAAIWDEWKDDGHTCSWLTAAEAESIGAGFENFQEVLADIRTHAGPDFRVIFWFDN